MNFHEIYNVAVPESKRKEEKFNIWVAIAVRPLSVLLTRPLLRVKIKPLIITAISILFSIAGFFVLLFAREMWLKIIGWSFFFLWAILDGVDGNYARCSDQCSQLGDLWDTTGGYLAMVCMYFVCGAIAFYDTNAVEFLNSYIYLMLGGATAVFSIFPRLVMHKKKSYGNNSEVIENLSNKNKFGFIQIVAMNFISPSGFMQIIFLLAILFHVSNLFIFFYCVVNFGIMCLSLFKLLKE